MKKILFTILITIVFANSSFAEDAKKVETQKTETKKAEAAKAAVPAATTKEDYKKKVEEQMKAYEGYVNKVREFEKSDKFKVNILNENYPSDVTLGDKKAPIKIVEYASLSCIHCKEFHENVFYNLKKDFIDTGKVYFKYRHFPLNGHALKAAVITGCVPEVSRSAFVGALFKSQNQWAYAKNEAGLIDRLKTISKIGGLSGAEFDKCYNNEAEQNKILELQKTAAVDLALDSTPSIFVNGVRYLGSRSYEDFKKVIEEKLASSKKDSKKLGTKAEVKKDLKAKKTEKNK